MSRQRIDDRKPHNVAAEAAVIGALLIDPDAILKVRAGLDPEDFYVASRRWCYEAILRLFEDDVQIDTVTVADELERKGVLKDVGGAARLTSLIGKTPTALNIQHYANIVRRTSQLRKLIDAGSKIIKLGYSDNEELSIEERYSNAEKLLYESRAEDKSRTATVNIRQAMNELHDEIDYRRAHPGMSGIPTGIGALDDMLDGMQKGNLIIIAGRPGMGKSSLALFIINHAAMCGYKCLLFSQEMSRLQLSQRIVSMRTGINMQRIRKSEQLSDAELPVVFDQMAKASKLPIWISTMSVATPGAMRAEYRRYSATEGGIDLVVGDHLGLMSTDEHEKNEVVALGLIGRHSKGLAGDEGIPVVLLHQLNRNVETRVDKHPVLSDLRGSGKIEENADEILFLYRDVRHNPNTEHPKIAEINAAKQRNGPTGIVEVEFDDTCGQWTERGTQSKLLLDSF